MNNNNENESDFFEIDKNDKSYNDWMESNGPPEIKPEEIEKQYILGDGSFGTVYKGKCRSKDVAVKLLHKQDFDEKTLQTFQQEVAIVSKIFHPNIVLFMGACTVLGEMMIVTELMPKGDLENMLADKKIQLSMLTRMKMAKDAALGMTWLHGSNPQFIHRDLKTSNLLVDENNRIKICDFGLSQIKKHGELLLDGVEGAKGTPLWMAPEVMAGRNFNEKADVYSFGIVLWEILTRREPFEEFDNFEDFRSAVCFDNVRPIIPNDCHPSLRRLIECCWQPNSERRPSFPEIVAALEHIIVDYAIQDSVGRRMWKERFLKNEYVTWSDFVESFFDVLDYYGDTTFQILPEQPTLKQIQNACNFQLNEYASRSLEHAKIIEDEILRRQKSMQLIEDIADVKLLCLKALIAEKPQGAVIDEDDEIVTMERFGNILEWFGPLVDPKTQQVIILDTVYDVLSQHWFHGDIGQLEAENRLARRAAGTFLIRFSSIVGCFTVSKYCSNSTIAHQRIIKSSGHGYIINNKCYSSLNELVQNASNELDLVHSCPGSRYISELFNDAVISGYIT
eukprot:TRINITY_DN1702_c0_g2_i1.p1 TRINITY_DN1702_c0_g2~~TRINITY_DN1702_c0_g2_i1.p1  ORF type:complete len:564 (+),score=180.30 TRINITY_DN1702_c0_g2_i1:100-1791(+)